MFVVGLVSKVVYWFDRYFVDGLVNFVGIATIFSGETLKYNTSGNVQSYVLSILLGVGLFVGLACLPFMSNIF